MRIWLLSTSPMTINKAQVMAMAARVTSSKRPAAASAYACTYGNANHVKQSQSQAQPEAKLTKWVPLQVEHNPRGH